ncbi:MAG TPA: hypothetical protein VF615_13680 [Longimicrobiaceae bacterium]|jgi:hypothetical protein
MSESKLALTWADLLLILVLSTIGSGVCALSAHVAERAMAPRAPKEAAFHQSARVPHLEQALSAAGDERNGIAAQVRELRFRQMRDSVGLVLADSDLVTQKSAEPPVSRAVLDSLSRERTRLQRSLRMDAMLAVQLRAAAARMSDSVASSRRALNAARKDAGKRYRAAQRRFALERAGWTAGGVVAASAMLLAITAFSLRPRPNHTPLVRRGRDIGISAAFIALFVCQQLLGAPLTLLLGAVIALFALLPHVNHAS